MVVSSAPEDALGDRRDRVMNNMKEGKFESVTALIKYGANLAGSSAGAAVGALVGGPAGAVIGAVSGTTLTDAFVNIGFEISNRFLGNREKERIGAVFAFAIEKVQENINNGQQIRQDGFFQQQLGERATAEEIVEGMLLAAQREHEEKKLRYYGNLLANIAFLPDVDNAQANLLIKLGESISYRQICILALFAPGRDFNLKQENYRDGNIKTAERAALLQEIYDLYSRGMLTNLSGSALLSMTDITPALTRIQGTGVTLYNLMELWKIDVQELHPIAKILR